MEGTDLANARLEGALLWQARLDGAYLANARLQGAILWGAQLDGAILREARLEGAFLEWVRLQGADLADARLEGADLEGARLEGVGSLGTAALRGAKLRDMSLENWHMTQEQINATFGDASVTDLDETATGPLSRPDHWPKHELDLFDFESEWRKWQENPDAYRPPEP
ncbi:pentapeptide repeat-containing protein [Sagittula sp. NFXS13]